MSRAFMKFDLPLRGLGLAILLVSAPWARGQLVINEILVNPPGPEDAPNEYIELRGPPNTVLPNGTCLLGIEGDAGDNPGTVQDLIDLSGRTIGQNGFLVLLQKNHRYASNPLSTVLTNNGSEPGWGSGSGSSIRHKGENNQTNLENPSCTFLLAQVPALPIVGIDLDAENDGLLDEATIAGWTLLDSVGILDPDGPGDIAYGWINFRRDSSPGKDATVVSGIVVPVSFTPSYVGRNGNTTGHSPADWVAGDNLKGTPVLWKLGANSIAGTNTVPAKRAGAYLNHLGKQNFGAPAIPAVLVRPPAAGIKLIEGGASGAYSINLAVAPTGRVTLRIDAPAGLLISTDGGVTFGASRAINLSSTALKSVRVRAPQDTNVDLSPRFGLITHTITDTLSPGRYPLSTVVSGVKVQITDNDFAVLSELKINPPGTNDAPFEFVEIRGTSGAWLTNIYLVAIDGNGGGNPGTALLVVNLTGTRFGTNGLLVVAAPNCPYDFPPGTPVVTAPAFGAPGGALGNGPLSILLLGSPSPILEGLDLDNGNNGVLEDLPDGSVILDAIGWSDGGGNDVIYGGVDLTQRSFVPDAATRFRTNNTPRSASAWMVGDLAGVTGDSMEYDDLNVSSNLPPGTVLTAGVLNDSAPDVSALAPLSHVIGDPDNLTVTFTVTDDQTPAAGLIVTATSTNPAVVPDANLTLTQLGGATWRLALDPVGVGYSDIIIHVSNGIQDQEGRGYLHYAASEPGRPGARWHTGISDASTAIPLDANWMLVGDDENQSLRIYSRTRSGPPVKLIDMNPFLGLTDLYADGPRAGTPREVDIEGSTRVGNRLYWLGSYSHAYNGEPRTNRGRIFATDLTVAGSNSTLRFVGRYDFLKLDLIEWDRNNAHGKGADYYGLEASDADGVDPKAPDGSGFNIEGLCMAPGSTTRAYLAFRAPFIPPPNRIKALIVPVTNFTTLAARGGGPGSARFGPPIELNLGGRGVRSIEGSAGRYLIVAGPPGRATNSPGGDFRLFTWTGQPAEAPVERDTDLTGMNPEGIVALPPAPWTPTSRAEIISDNGITVYYGDTIEAKHLEIPNFKKFRSEWVALGNPVTTSPLIQAMRLADGTLTISWESEPGTTYCVEAKDDLPGAGWVAVPGEITATGRTTSKAIPLGTMTQCFFRVKVVAP